MLVIRKEQMDALGRRRRQEFEEKLIAHFLRTYPREVRQAGGESQVRQVVLDGIDRANRLGFDTKRQVTLFVSLLFMLGCDFDSDPQLPWTRQLSDKSITSPDVRIISVYDEALEYLTETAGENCELVVRALLRIRAYDLKKAPQSSGEQFIADILRVLEGFCPEKFEYQDEEINRRLVSAGIRTARRYGITANHGVLVMVTLMFMLGSGIDHDPLHPWAQRALTDSTITTEAARIERLYQEAMAHTALSLQAD